MSGTQSRKNTLKKVLNVLQVINNTQPLDLAGQLGIDGFGTRKKDLIPFLMDILSMLAGGKSLEDLLYNILGSQLEEIDNTVRIQLRDSLKAKCGEAVLNSGFPAWMGGGGLEINFVNIDIFDLLKTIQGTGGVAGDYAGNVLGQVDDFNRKIMESVDMLNNAIPMEYNGQQIMNVTYTGSGFIFEIGVDYTNKTVENFIDDYFDGLVLFPIDAIVAAIVNLLTGIFDRKSGKSFEDIMEMQQIDGTINKMADADCGEIVNEETAFYKFSRDELELFRFNASNKSSGTVSFDLGCGTLVTEVSDEAVKNLINVYKESVSSELFITKSARKSATQDLINGVADLMIGGKLFTVSTIPADTDDQTIKDDIIKMLLDHLKNVFLKQALSPQTLVMLILVGYALVDDSELQDQGSGQPKKIDIGPERLQIFASLGGAIREIVKILYELIVKNFFQNLSYFIQRLMADIALGILKEKLDIWVQSIKATMGRFGKAVSKTTKRIL
tara:strand:- start:2886 stop:4382 length:1497 start_codon:yes stop_codon:yes gene_type:complete